MTPTLTPTELESFRSQLEPPVWSKYIPHTPTDRQLAGLVVKEIPEILYGGAAGGGKTDWLLMCALQYAEVKGYAALLLRRTHTQANKADSIVPRSHAWLHNTDAHWDGQNSIWRFPSGATIEIGHMQHEKDKYNYQGGAYQLVCFDELTQFLSSMYLYLFSRRRRLMGSAVPIRMRSGSNPGGEGHEWVKQRFLVERDKDRLFLPAKLDDNPHLDAEEYKQSLMNLDPVTRAQLLNGDWVARQAGSLFQPEWFGIVDAAPIGARSVRGWDLAATAPKPGKDPDYFAGCRMSTLDGVYFIEDMRRTRTTPAGVDKLLEQTTKVDGRKVNVWIEQEPGSAGKIVIAHYVKMLAGYAVRGQASTGDKVSRAGPLSSQAEAGNVKLVSGPWIRKFLDEAELFGTEACAHDDQIDAASLAFSKLAAGRIQIRGGVAA